jgi:hypothetical protein
MRKSFMNLKMIVAILVISALPVCAQGREGDKRGCAKGRQNDQRRQGHDPDLL